VKIAVVGVGQDMRGDDAAGLEATRAWQERHPDEAGAADIQVSFVLVPALELARALEGIGAAVLVDATSGAGEPGTVRAVGLSELEGSTAAWRSVHGWGLPEELRLGKLLGQLPPDLVVRLVGIEAGEMGLGTSLSPAVRAALPCASDRIQSEIERIRTLKSSLKVVSRR